MKSDHRKAQILDCARKVFAVNGYHKANIAMICKEAGIGRGTLYQYFKNKESVFKAIIEDIVSDITVHMKEKFASIDKKVKNQKDISEFLAGRLEIAFQHWLSDRYTARIIFEHSTGINEFFSRMRRKVDNHFINLIRVDIKKGIKLGFIRMDIDPYITAVKMWGGMEKVSLISLSESKDGLPEKKIKQLARQILSIDLYGISK